MASIASLSFFISSFLLLLAPSLASNSEGNALNILRGRLSDPNKVLSSWDPTLVNPCTWFHVTCDSNNRVTRLDLGNAGLSGTLGPELRYLKRLNYMELFANNISGKIPRELGKLKYLISLDLYSNRFEGNIPKSFGKLKSLRFLRLNNNNLTGPIPRQLTKLKNLQIFDVSNNDLCGTIPVDGPFSNFTNKRCGKEGGGRERDTRTQKTKEEKQGRFPFRFSLLSHGQLDDRRSSHRWMLLNFGQIVRDIRIFILTVRIGHRSFGLVRIVDEQTCSVW